MLEGLTLPGLTPSDEKASVPITQGRWWLIAYYSSDRATAVSRAGHVDKLIRRFADKPVSTVGLVAPDSHKIALSLKGLRLDYPILVDQDRQAARLLHLPWGEDRLWLISPSGEIRFAASGEYLLDDDLRQLLEKALLGEVTYGESDAEERRPLAPGDLFPETHVLSLRTGTWKSRSDLVGQGINRFVVFTADCVSCTLYSYLNRFRAAAKAMGSGGRRVAGIFGSRFSVAEVQEQASSIGLNTALFLAKDEIRGIEDGYYLTSLIAPVVVVDTDNDGVVQEVLTFDALYAELEEASKAAQ